MGRKAFVEDLDNAASSSDHLPRISLVRRGDEDGTLGFVVSPTSSEAIVVEALILGTYHSFTGSKTPLQ